jgi:hypothetical protein
MVAKECAPFAQYSTFKMLNVKISELNDETIKRPSKSQKTIPLNGCCLAN